jgi:hydroxyacylglutathione hydrolase
VTPAELAARIDSGSPPTILDVRSGREFAAGHIPGAVHVPFWAVVAGHRVPGNPDEPIVVYCQHGPRAHLAGSALRRRGFQQVAYLDGHMTRWIREGRPRQTGR